MVIICFKKFSMTITTISFHTIKICIKIFYI